MEIYSGPPTVPPRKPRIAPYALTAMIFGIVSIAVMCYFGWVAAIVALVLYRKGITAYRKNPQIFKPQSLSMLKTARVCGIIGLIVSLVTLVLYILYIVFIIGMASRHSHF